MYAGTLFQALDPPDTIKLQAWSVAALRRSASVPDASYCIYVCSVYYLQLFGPCLSRKWFSTGARKSLRVQRWRTAAGAENQRQTIPLVGEWLLCVARGSETGDTMAAGPDIHKRPLDAIPAAVSAGVPLWCTCSRLYVLFGLHILICDTTAACLYAGQQGSLGQGAQNTHPPHLTCDSMPCSVS